MVKVEVVYLPRHAPVFHRCLQVPPGTTVAEVIAYSGVLSAHPEVQDCPAGVFGQQVLRDYVVCEHDRVELYRPLLIDPKEKRKARAGNQRGR